MTIHVFTTLSIDLIIRHVSGELRYNSTNSDIVRSLRAIASIIAITAVVSIEDRLFNLC